MNMDEAEREYIANEQAQATARRWAVVLLVVGWAMVYWVWPAEITALPLAAIKFGALLQTLLSGVTALVTLILAVMLWI